MKKEANIVQAVFLLELFFDTDFGDCMFLRNNQVEKDEMSGSCSTNGGGEERV
jgi:hypothetical protein